MLARIKTQDSPLPPKCFHNLATEANQALQPSIQGTQECDYSPTMRVLLLEEKVMCKVN